MQKSELQTAQRLNTSNYAPGIGMMMIKALIANLELLKHTHINIQD